MCAVVGALVWKLDGVHLRDMANSFLNRVVACSHERGRDGRGFVRNFADGVDFDKSTERSDEWIDVEFFDRNIDVGIVIGNLRAEPTTEYVADKTDDDQQPYMCGKWTVVHNGTIANDKQLRTNEVPTSIDSAAIVEALAQEESSKRNDSLFGDFQSAVKKLKGSYAILACHSDNRKTLFVATNYRPVWYVKTEIGVFFASARSYLPSGYAPQMIKPYSAMEFRYEASTYSTKFATLCETTSNNRALVVCSGGLDSVVSATCAQRNGYEIELIHFQYGSRAEGPEVSAIKAVGEALGAKTTFFPLPVYKPEDSPLLRKDSSIAGGEAGAEFAHEWVPARNLVMLSVATAYAEANGFDTIVLGNNLEEAGAYPDNEPEFIARFNDILPFAVGAGKHIRVAMPVGNLMKHEIVSLGAAIGAPMHLTWSCYRAGERHCGTCGPCYMRRKAFEMNSLEDPISYES